MVMRVGHKRNGHLRLPFAAKEQVMGANCDLQRVAVSTVGPECGVAVSRNIPS